MSFYAYGAVGLAINEVQGSFSSPVNPSCGNVFLIHDCENCGSKSVVPHRWVPT